MSVSRFQNTRVDHWTRRVILQMVQSFRVMLNCCRARIGYIKNAGLGIIVGILLVCAEEPNRKFSSRYFSRHKMM